MCSSSCGGLFTPNVRLDQVKCPCGHGYWDVWRAAFVTGDMVRNGSAPPKEDYVARVQANLSKTKYEAKIRRQYIEHFLGCEIKRADDDKVTREGKNDGSSLRRAITEWWEYESGDYGSKGTSKVFDAKTLKKMWSQLSGTSKTDDDIRPLLLQRTSTDDRQQSEISRPSVPPTASSEDNSQRYVPIIEQPSPPATGAGRGVGEVKTAYFVPGEGLRHDVLKHHCERGMFGPSATVQPHTNENGVRGFRITGTIRPTASTLRTLGADSSKAEAVRGSESRPRDRTSLSNPSRTSGFPAGYDGQVVPATRRQDTSLHEPSSRKVIDDVSQRVGEMDISEEETRHVPEPEPAKDTLEPSNLSSPRTNTEKFPRDVRYDQSKEKSEEEHDHGTTHTETSETPDHPSSQKVEVVKWECCKCRAGPYKWPATKKCSALDSRRKPCQHTKCPSCRLTTASPVQARKAEDNSPDQSSSNRQGVKKKDSSRRSGGR